jgi:predicted RNA-binding Zn-ribbon protein involved in translation (DUF1610 family)
MINDKPLEITLPIYTSIPHQNEIRDRLSRRFGPMSIPMAPVINQAAEELERLLMEICDPTGKQREMVIHYIPYTGENKGHKIMGYSCKKCSHSQIKTIYHYCPCCGTKIIWVKETIRYKKAS